MLRRAWPAARGSVFFVVSGPSLDGALLEVIKSVYGLPDAPRAWWEELTKYLRELGFTHTRMDIAFMVRYSDSGEVTAILILHVDDIMIAWDGSKEVAAVVEKLRKRFPFGEWVRVAEQKEGVQRCLAGPWSRLPWLALLQ